MKKVVKLTESQIENLVRKVLEEQSAVSGGAAGMSRAEINNLPKCSELKNVDKIIGGVVKKHMVGDSRLQAFQAAANSANIGTSVYVEVNKKPFCKIK